jgi:hypothetical protein
MTNLDDDVLERRLRETFQVVAAGPIGPGRVPAMPDSARPRIRHKVTAVLVAAAIMLVFLVPLPHVSLFKSLVASSKVTTPPTVVPATTPSSVVPATVTTTSQGLPQSVVGTEQSLVSVAVPTWFAYTTPSPCSTVLGQPVAFNVGDSPPFIVFHESMSARTPRCPINPVVPSPNFAWLEYVGNGLAGTGYDGSAGSPGTVEGTATSLFIIDPWPVAGQQVYVWADLPSDVRYVTYSFQGQDLAWVRPQSGVAAFLVPRPAAFDGSYAVWHTAPFPIVTAYNASGQQLAQEKAPRVDGDDFGTSAT